MDRDRDQGDQPWVDAEEAGGLHQGPWGSRDQDPAAASAFRVQHTRFSVQG